MSPLTVLVLSVPAAPSRTARPFQFVTPDPVPAMLVETSVPETFAPSSVTTSSELLVAGGAEVAARDGSVDLYSRLDGVGHDERGASGRPVDSADRHDVRHRVGAGAEVHPGSKLEGGADIHPVGALQPQVCHRAAALEVEGGAAPADVIVAFTAGSGAPGGAGPGPAAGPTKASGFVPGAVTDSEYAPGAICTVSFAAALVTA